MCRHGPVGRPRPPVRRAREEHLVLDPAQGCRDGEAVRGVVGRQVADDGVHLVGRERVRVPEPTGVSSVVNWMAPAHSRPIRASSANVSPDGCGAPARGRAAGRHPRAGGCRRTVRGRHPGRASASRAETGTGAGADAPPVQGVVGESQAQATGAQLVQVGHLDAVQPHGLHAHRGGSTVMSEPRGTRMCRTRWRSRRRAGCPAEGWSRVPAATDAVVTTRPVRRLRPAWHRPAAGCPGAHVRGRSSCGRDTSASVWIHSRASWQ